MNLQLRSGRILALPGANGAGKSTAMPVMLGLCDADQGDASLLDQLPQAMEASAHWNRPSASSVTRYR